MDAPTRSDLTTATAPTPRRTFAQLRQLLGFGPKRLKILLALIGSGEIDGPDWHGEFRAAVGPRGEVKSAAQRALREIHIPEDR